MASDYKYQDDEKTLYTDDGVSIPWFTSDTDAYLNKTTLIFGGSGSGKTTIIEEILVHLQKACPNFLVIAPKTSRKAYSKKFPKRCIKEDLTKQKIEAIWQRQYYVTQMYNIANDMTVMESIFEKKPDRETKLLIAAIKKRTETFIDGVRRSSENWATKKGQITRIEELQEKRIRALYKKYIIKNQESLKRITLNKKQMVAVEYVDFNPNFTLVIDDSSEKISKWLKYWKKGNEESPIEKIFFKGRWQNITLVLGAHDDKFVPPELRKNGRNTIFCERSALIAGLNKQSSGYTKDQKKTAEKMALSIFDDESSKFRTHKKFVYVREDAKPFKYFIANLYPEIKMGCDALYDLAKSMPKQEDDFDSNPFLQQYISPGNSAKKKKKAKYKPSRGRHKYV